MLYNRPGVNKLQETYNRSIVASESEHMELRAFSIYDAKGEIFNTPFFKKTIGEAERDFATLCKDEKSMPGKYPDDFDLYEVGRYDDCTGKFVALETPRHLIKAVQLLSN